MGRRIHGAPKALAVVKVPLLLAVLGAVSVWSSAARSQDAPVVPPSFPPGDHARGIDVSRYDGTIDWGQVAASGVSFGFTESSHGLAIIDTSFAPNWEGMKAHGIIRGVYEYLAPSQDPVKQADLMLDQVKAAGGFQPGDLPPVLDIETRDPVPTAHVVSELQAWMDELGKKAGIAPPVLDAKALDGVPDSKIIDQAQAWAASVEATTGIKPGGLPPDLDKSTVDGLSNAQVIAAAQAWIGEVKKKTGMSPLVYASPSFWKDLDAGRLAGKNDLWIANWRVASPRVPSSWDTWRFWQFTDSGSVAGVSSLVDTDVFNGTVSQLRAYARNPMPSPDGHAAPEGLPLPASRAPSKARSGPAPAPSAAVKERDPSKTPGLVGGLGQVDR